MNISVLLFFSKYKKKKERKEMTTRNLGCNCDQEKLKSITQKLHWQSCPQSSCGHVTEGKIKKVLVCMCEH